MIRNLVEELNKHGVKADIDEMNFSKSYQIILKLDKISRIIQVDKNLLFLRKAFKK